MHADQLKPAAKSRNIVLCKPTYWDRTLSIAIQLELDIAYPVVNKTVFLEVLGNETGRTTIVASSMFGKLGSKGVHPKIKERVEKTCSWRGGSAKRCWFLRSSKKSARDRGSEW
jgi:hypothetical protein